jgi:hypothetical protein
MKADPVREYPRWLCFQRTMKIDQIPQASILNEKSLLGSCLSTAPDELRTARDNHLLTGVKSCVPIRYTARWHRE